MNELLAGFAAQTGSGRFLPCPVTHRPPRRRGSSWADVGASASTSPTATTCSPSARTCWKRWGSVVVNRHAWGQARPRAPNPPCVWPMPGRAEQHGRGRRSRLPIKPGTELFLLLGVARQLIKDGVAAPPEGWMTSRRWSPSGPRKKSAKSRASCPNVSPPSSTGSKAKKPLVVVGSDMDQGGGTGPVRIGMAINMLLDRVNKEGGMRMIPLAPRRSTARRPTMSAHAGRSRPLRRRHGAGEHARSGRAHGLRGQPRLCPARQGH